MDGAEMEQLTRAAESYLAWLDEMFDGIVTLTKETKRGRSWAAHYRVREGIEPPEHAWLGWLLGEGMGAVLSAADSPVPTMNEIESFLASRPREDPLTKIVEGLVESYEDLLPTHRRPALRLV